MEDYHRGGGMAAFGGVAAEEFQEDDDIRALREAASKHPKPKKGVSSASPWCFATTAARPIPRTAGVATPHGYASAPLNIPDWSKILKQQQQEQQPPPRKKLWDDDDDDIDGDGWRRTYHDHHVKYDDGDYDDDGMVPPHEYLARSRKHANRKNVSFSMCEGVGGTLKGRDLCKLRNAILTKTGFLEGHGYIGRSNSRLWSKNASV